METGYYSATGGMVTQLNRLDTIANNIANANTAGFKRDGLITGDFMRMYKESRDDLPLENHTKEAAKFYNRSVTRVPQIVEQYTDQSVGTLEKTGNKLDLALSREGLFFAVETPEGIRLTRNGNFSLDDKGTLITKEGYKVLPADYYTAKGGIEFSTNSPEIVIDKNGQISTNVPNTNRFLADKKLMIVEPQNIKALKKEGDTFYIPEASDPLIPLTEVGSVRQGFIEKSNVNPMMEMISLIEAERSFEMYTKVMQAQMDDMNKEAITKLAAKQ
ncbi:MAG: flagellar hook-basal body complex protein [Helicobacteraceae bacterium]|nr:flagellar hook-basal body complex protein [Helicobacteraceae bacterium]